MYSDHSVDAAAARTVADVTVATNTRWPMADGRWPMADGDALPLTGSMYGAWEQSYCSSPTARRARFPCNSHICMIHAPFNAIVLAEKRFLPSAGRIQFNCRSEFHYCNYVATVTSVAFVS